MATTLREVLGEELAVYLQIREAMRQESGQGYPAGDGEFVRAAELFYRIYDGGFYDALAMQLQLYGIPNDEKNEEFIDIYNEFYKVYFNFVDEVLLAIAVTNQESDEQITVEQVFKQLDPEDITYALDDNLQHFEDKALMGDVSRAYIIQAIRRILTESDSL